jgi:hypothetical protein
VSLFQTILKKFGGSFIDRSHARTGKGGGVNVYRKRGQIGTFLSEKRPFSTRFQYTQKILMR